MKYLKYSLIILFILLLFLLFFNILQQKFVILEDKYNLQYKNISIRVDSLENELNTFYKIKKDTIIINVVPADIKIYPKIYNH